MIYDYEYDPHPEDETRDEQLTRQTRNVARSMAMDPIRLAIAPSAEQLHLRVLRETARRNGHTHTPA